jgi:hypothetical protein
VSGKPPALVARTSDGHLGLGADQAGKVGNDLLGDPAGVAAETVGAGRHPRRRNGGEPLSPVPGVWWSGARGVVIVVASRVLQGRPRRHHVQRRTVRQALASAVPAVAKDA